MVVEIVIIGPEKVVKKMEIDKAKVRDVLKKLGLLVSEHVVLKNNVIATEDDEVRDGDKLVIYPVKSGG